MGWVWQSIKTDCRHYIGEKPCKFKRTCPGCPNYAPMGVRILIIKLGAAGDALRTTPILREMKSAHGHCHITWATDLISYELLKGNPFIDKLLRLDWAVALELTSQKFDVVYCADKAPSALALAAQVKAERKLGFTMNENGALDIFDERGEQALFLGISDPFKFRKNQKTYQHITFEMFGLPWNQQPYVFELSDTELQAAARKMESIGATGKLLIGLNTGAGPVFATKKWPTERFVELARNLKQRMDCHVLIMGGPDERERNAKILGELEDQVLDAGCDNPVRVFAGMVGMLDALVTADTLAMHLAVAQSVPTVAMFGPTAQQEVTLYGNGDKLTGRPDCAPCYKAVCPEEDANACMRMIAVEDVLSSLLSMIGNAGTKE